MRLHYPLEFSNMYPGFVGGHCISVDPYYLIQKAQIYGVFPRILSEARRVNDGMGEYVAGEVIKCMNKKGVLVKNANILILGFTFKENCPDIRNAKVVDIYDTFLQYTKHITIHDIHADKDEVKAQYGIILNQERLEDLRHQFDTVILSVKHKEYSTIEDVRSLLRISEGVVYDVKSFLPQGDVDKRL